MSEIKNNPIEVLRQAGFKVRVRHFRAFWDMSHVLHDPPKPGYKYSKKFVLAPYSKTTKNYPIELIDNDTFNGYKEFLQLFKLSPRGGKTIVEIDAPDGTNYYIKSNCSLNDQFCYKTGVYIALLKILYPFGKETFEGALKKFILSAQGKM